MSVVKFFAAVIGAFVVLLIGFSAITRPAHGDKTKVYFAILRADLRNLVTGQEMYFADSSRYAPSLQALDTSRFQASQGVSIELRVHGDTGWSATARHIGLPEDGVCTIAVGTPPGQGNEMDGEPQCSPLARRSRSWYFIWE